MTRFHLPENTRLHLNGALFKVVALTSNGDVHLSNIETGEPYLTSSKDLANAIYEGIAKLVDRSSGPAQMKCDPKLTSFDAFDDKVKSEARRRLKFVKKVDSLYLSNLNQAVVDSRRFFSEGVLDSELVNSPWNCRHPITYKVRQGVYDAQESFYR